MKLRITPGDITQMECEVIVNPANSLGVMGGGVAAAIKEAGGEEIESEATKQAPIPLGKAVATSAGKLKCKFVIHSPTMEKPAEKSSAEIVKNATLAALKLADELKVKSVCFPGMGTGTGGLGYGDAANAMVVALQKFMMMREDSKVKEVFLVAKNEELHSAFSEAVKKVMR